MLRPRIIPCLLVQNGGLVKTVQFAKPKYVGDPINAVKIFNEKEVDELFVADIDATVKGNEPDYALITKLAAECRMPLCYAGGVGTAQQVQDIISLGVEKVAISSEAVARPELVKEAAERVGSQSIVVVLDVKKRGLRSRYEIHTHNGRKSTSLDPVAFAEAMEDAGAGEIVVNSIDCDGMMKGYDSKLIARIRAAVSLPITALGGAGSLSDIESLITNFGLIGASAGSLFVFKGVYRAVLINYPKAGEKDLLFQRVQGSFS